MTRAWAPKPEDAGASQQRRDVDADLAERGEHCQGDDDHLAPAAHQRHHRAQARAAPAAALPLHVLRVLVVQPQGGALDGDLPVGHDLQQLRTISPSAERTDELAAIEPHRLSGAGCRRTVRRCSGA